MVGVEVCINCDSNQSVTASVSAARLGGASTIELCSAMKFDGLTPLARHIDEARQAFKDHNGLMVMIRPRKGDFYFSDHEIQLMREQIKIAANWGADGVVFGVLQKNDNAIAVDKVNSLVELCHKYNLRSTFHRAFDATPNFLESVRNLIDAGVDRVLTSGTKWYDRRPAIDGLNNLRSIIKCAENRIETVIGGGISPQNVDKILGELPVQNSRISVHAYSGVQQDGVVTKSAVHNLVETVQYCQS